MDEPARRFIQPFIAVHAVFVPEGQDLSGNFNQIAIQCPAVLPPGKRVVPYLSGRLFSHISISASLGMRQSARGERAIVPTFGPSGRQDLLNC